MKMAAWQQHSRLQRAKRSGGSTVEYAVILGLISLVSLGALTTLGVKSKAVYEQVVAALHPEPEPHSSEASPSSKK